MLDYRRLISYMYEYEGKEKGKNVGFVKLEARNGQCRLNVNVKRMYVGGNAIGAYLLGKDGENTFLGNVFVRNGAGEFRTTVDAVNVEGSGRTLDAYYGLTVHDVKSAWRSYTTMWEDANVPEVPECVAAEVTGNRDEETGAQVQEAGVREKVHGAQEEAEATREEVTRAQVQEAGVRDAETEAQAEETGDQEEVTRAQAEGIGTKEEVTGALAQSEAVRAQEEVTRTRAQAARGQNKAAGMLAQAEKAGEQVTTAEAKRNISEAQEEGTRAQREAKRMQIDVAPNLMAEEILPGSADIPTTAHTISDFVKEIEAEMEKEIARTAEVPVASPELENPEVLRYLQESEDAAPNLEILWQEMRKAYPKIQPFDYDGTSEVLTIHPQDIGQLPRENWVYGNNSFLLHGYYNFRYLILVRLQNENGQPRYLIGVPGHYYNSEKYMANMFGFPNFVLSKKQPPNDGRFGYWYTDVRQ